MCYDSVIVIFSDFENKTPEPTEFHVKYYEKKNTQICW